MKAGDIIRLTQKGQDELVSHGFTIEDPRYTADSYFRIDKISEHYIHTDCMVSGGITLNIKITEPSIYETVCVGDQFKINQVGLENFNELGTCLKDGQLWNDTILTVSRIDMEKQSIFFDNTWAKVDYPSDQWPAQTNFGFILRGFDKVGDEVGVAECTCDLFTVLMVTGCRCGYIEKERAVHGRRINEVME